MQPLTTTLHQKSNRFPHHQVVPTKFLVGRVRGTELVDGIFAELEENRTGNELCATSGKNYKAMTAFDGFSIYIKKKGQGLGGDAMSPPCSDVKTVELQNRLARCGHLDIQAAFLGFPNCAAHRTRESD